jgi:AcrR family transcriptional regulator
MLTVTTSTRVHPIVDTVNMQTEKPYHHGNLRDELIEAAMTLARGGGPDAVVLRAATRNAGVSHNAAYRHFADRDALLRAVCDRCMARLADRMDDNLDRVPPSDDLIDQAWSRLAAVGLAYIEFAQSEPGWFRTAYSVPGRHEPFGLGEGVGRTGRTPIELLSDCLDRLLEVGGISVGARPNAEYAAWCGVHGLSTLIVDGPLRTLSPAERETATGKVLQVIADGLRFNSQA